MAATGRLHSSLSLLSRIPYMELAVSKTENFLGTWGKEIPSQGRSDRTEEDLEQLVPHASTPVAPHASAPLVPHSSTPVAPYSSTPVAPHTSTPGIFPAVSQTNSKAWCCLGTAVMGTLQKREKHYCDFSAQIGRKRRQQVRVKWSRDGWRKRQAEDAEWEGGREQQSGNQGTSKAVRQGPSSVPQVLLAPVHLEDC